MQTTPLATGSLFGHLLALVVVATSGAGCDDGGTSPKPVADVVQEPLLDRKQGYRLTLTFHGGKADGKVIVLDRDLGGDQGKLAFGNTHLQPPAVSFAVIDSESQPFGGTVAPLDVQFRFGILIEAANHPINIGKPGIYPFGCGNPLVQVNFVDGMYRSSCPDLDGQLEIVDWSAEPGGRFRGRVQGRLQHYFFSSTWLDDCDPAGLGQTCKDTLSWVDISGDFSFTLPPLNSDVAP